jgi:hypothetical protein
MELIQTDLQEFISNSMKARRAGVLAQSDQLTLGEMILKLEPIVSRQKEIIKKYKAEAMVRFDFEYLFPTAIDSWRGSYAELALNFCDGEGNDKQMTVSEFLRMLKETIGKTLTGYKGGDFLMTKHTPVWVANYSRSGNTAVVDIVDNEYEVLIMTGYREY